ncbi:type II secretion system minor pseudopilin GspI [Porticoccus sp. W117]|uniref:type II secretion system minor pseudopilin GspI n=1 Tax=Porticoccus sp. W117 TaxID=3054777 RepID=UPI0025925FFC|nr:type II secretion system minor pseudopilin GspI [Porticoccus sp. W117]MDM3872566.1 type II secretion system minor pseudopilin GspI [Porticoccus sp. W117]
MTDWRQHQAGFTLLELMIALVVFAVTALVVLENSSASVRQQARLEDKTLATWVAENSIAELRLQPYWPSLGVRDQQVQFANRDWHVRQETLETPDPRLRKVIAQVRSNRTDDQPIVELTGYLRERR